MSAAFRCGKLTASVHVTGLHPCTSTTQNTAFRRVENRDQCPGLRGVTALTAHRVQGYHIRMHDRSKSIVIGASGVEKNRKGKWGISRYHETLIGCTSPIATDLLAHVSLTFRVSAVDIYGVVANLSCGKELHNGFQDRSLWLPVVRRYEKIL